MNSEMARAKAMQHGEGSKETTIKGSRSRSRRRRRNRRGQSSEWNRACKSENFVHTGRRIEEEESENGE